MRGNGLLVAQASGLPRRRHLPRTEAGEPLALRGPSGRDEVRDVTIPVWYLRNIVARPKKAKTCLLAHSSDWSLGERHGHYSMKLSHQSYFNSDLRVRGRRILRLRSEGGDALFEFAMVIPLLSMLLVGIIYGGITFYDYVTLADAVAIGARAIVTNRGAGAGPPNACSMGETALDNAAASLKGTITIGTGSGTESFTGTGGSTCSALVAGDYVTITAKYPCSMTIPFTGVNLCPIQGSGGSFISSSTTMRIE